MDSLFHFVFPIIAALAARINIKHMVRTILAAAFLTVLVDLDHFIGLERVALHNVFITILIPLILLSFSFYFKLSRNYKNFFFLLLIFLSSHLFLDMFSSPAFGNGIGIEEGIGIALFYPLSNARYSIDFNMKVTTRIGLPYEGYIVSTLGFGLLLYFTAILLPCLFLDDIMDIAERHHEKLVKAAKEFFRNLLKD